jgi:cellulose 1,4-beta-cellobiosidase
VKGVAAVKLSWTPVPGATGYAIYRSTSPDGPFAFPDNFVNGTGSASYIDKGITAGTPYYYQVTAVNAAGISPAAVVAVP